MINPNHVPVWYKTINSAEWITQKAVKKGAQKTFVAHFPGRKWAYTFEVGQYEPHNIFIMQSSRGPFPMETEYAWRKWKFKKMYLC